MIPSVDAKPAGSLPPSAEHANDLEAIKKTVEDAAGVSGGLWISYLFVLFYLAIAAGAVSHADLFLENPVRLPFLNIELPIKAFFLLAPILFCVMHIYTLTHFVILSNKARWYHDELNRQIEETDDPSCDASQRARDIRDRLRRQLPSNIFVQFLAGPDEIRHSAFGLLLKTIAWTTLVIGPVLLLLLLQIQFLPYHSRSITWTTRLLLLADLVVVWWLWHIILLGQGEFKQKRRTVSHVGTIAGALLSASVIFFSWALATFPGEPIEAALSGWRPFHDINESNKTIAVSVHDYLFNRHIDPTTRRRSVILSSTLVLPVFNIFEQLKIENPERLDIHKYVFRARGRDLRGAVFDLSVLANIDLEGAFLQGASLDRADLKNASFDCAHLQHASLYRANLEGTKLYSSNLQGAELRYALGQGAAFDGASLQGATLVSAHFEGGSFKSANLDAASLVKARFDGAAFEAARRSGPIAKARLEGASFDSLMIQVECADRAQMSDGADLNAADLTGASLRGASLNGAQLQGASLKNAELDGADLSHAFLWRADLAGQNESSGIVKMTAPTWTAREARATGKDWTEADYQGLVRSLRDIVPAGDRPDAIAKRLSSLDCDDKKRAPCDAAGTPSPAGLALERRTGDTAYDAALSDTINDLVCSGDPNALSILRGLLINGRLAAAARTTSILTVIQQPDCLVSKALTEDDEVNLMGLKRRLTPSSMK